MSFSFKKKNLTLSLTQRLELFFVYRVVDFLWFLEKHLKKFTRLLILFFIFFVCLSGFFLKGQEFGFIYNVPLLFAPGSPETLGTYHINYPLFINESSFPTVTAKSVFAVDINKNRVLVDYNSNLILPPASTTKLMTALVSLDLYDTKEYVRIPKNCTQIEAQTSGLRFGSFYKVEDLLTALLVHSSADAACSLATGKVGYYTFVGLMNQKAGELGMKSTKFTNPIGLDGTNGSHISTSRDLFKLAKHAVSKPLIDILVRKKIATIYSLSGNPVNIWNTNDLLWEIPGSVGIKTGKTKAAGEVLIYRYEDSKKGEDIIIVVMGSQDRFKDTGVILGWILGNYNWGK